MVVAFEATNDNKDESRMIKDDELIKTQAQAPHSSIHQLCVRPELQLDWYRRRLVFKILRM